MIAFHGTSKEAAELIINNGFKMNECSDFGKAVYFSYDIEVAKQYGSVIIEVKLNGNILNMQNDEHFTIYKQQPNERIKAAGFDALKDNYIIAVYNKKIIELK